MSVCSNTFRAFSRSRVSATKTLLPFLYQTATIQHWKVVSPPITRRQASSRSNAEDDIPFDDGSLPTPVDQVDTSRKTTITSSERAAFEKLYKKFNTQGKPQDDKHREVELDQIADEYYEDDDDGSPATLDSLFDAVLKGTPHREANKQKKNPKSKHKKVDKNLAMLAEKLPRSSSKAEKAAAEKAKVELRRKEERTRIDKLMTSAQTDREVWEVLHREVFDPIRKLDLDGIRKNIKQQSKSKKAALQSEPSTVKSGHPSKANLGIHDPRILFPNYPHHLVIATEVFRTHFPASPLPFHILPAVKSLGRSSYALGATTRLYAYLIRFAWRQQSSYTLIDSLLADMDNGGIEFDMRILNVLDDIIKQHRRGRNGDLGRGFEFVLKMEQHKESVRKIEIWHQTVSNRIGNWAASLANKRKLIRKHDPQQDSFGLSKGPQDEIKVGMSQALRGDKLLASTAKTEQLPLQEESAQQIAHEVPTIENPETPDEGSLTMTTSVEESEKDSNRSNNSA